MNQIFFRLFAVLLSVAGAAPAPAHAQNYPSKPITLIVPYPPGGQTDIVGREIANGLSQALGQPVIVQNIGGAAGRLGTSRAAKSPADGYTLLVGASHVTVVIMSMIKDPGYDTLKDFAPLSLLGQAPLVLEVRPGLPAASLKELIAMSKSNPGKLSYASAGEGSVPHLATVLLAARMGVDMLHVPFQGTAPAITSLLGGHVNLCFDNIPTALPLVTTGKLRALAVSSLKRSPMLPDVPTVAESGIPDFDVQTWTGIFAPAGIPKNVSARLGAELVRIMQAPEMRAKFSSFGMEPIGNTPEEFSVFVRSEIGKWAAMARSAGIKPE